MRRLRIDTGVVDLSALSFDAAHGFREGEGEYRRVLDSLWPTDWSFSHGNTKWPDRLLLVTRMSFTENRP